MIFLFVCAPGFILSFFICSLGLVLARTANEITSMATTARHSGSTRVRDGVTESCGTPSEDGGVT